MKILFVSFSKSSESHAYHTRILQLARYCKKLGAETNVLFLGDLFFGSPVLIQPLNLLFNLRYLKSFDVVCAEGHGPAYFLALAKPLIGRSTLVVYDVHSDALTESFLMAKGRFDIGGLFSAVQMRFTESIALKSIDYFVAAWPGLRQRYLSRNNRIKEQDFEVVLNGVNIDLFKPEKTVLSTVHSSTFTVTYAGSFYQIEGTEPLIRAAEMLRSEDVYFKLIGFRKEDSGLKAGIQKRLGSKATLLDWLPKNELIAELLKSDILVIPADDSTIIQSENRAGLIPTKFAEFLALAKPVIVTKLDGTSGIVEQYDCGFVCEPTAESIADAILRAKNTPKNVLVEKGLNGRKYAEAELDYTLICRRYLSFLAGILKKRAV